MWDKLYGWLFPPLDEKSRTRQLIELSVFYMLFVLVIWYHGEVPVSIATLLALFPVGLLVAYLSTDARELLRITLIAGIIVFGLIRPYVVQAFYIPSRSMENTLLINDHIFVNKFVYYFQKPRRWDIIVFEYPKNPEKDYIKRLVGLPGDTVALRNHELFINNRKVPRRYLNTEVEMLVSPPALTQVRLNRMGTPRQMFRFDGDGLSVNRDVVVGNSPRSPVQLRVGQSRMLMEAQSHRIKITNYEGLNQSPSYTKNFGPVHIPRTGESVDLTALSSREIAFYMNLMRLWFGDRITYRNGVIYRGGVPQRSLEIREPLYFAMGDNRDQSEDSRAWGFIPASRLLGEAFFIYWPPGRVGFIGP